jgi:hypothetical protein
MDIVTAIIFLGMVYVIVRWVVTFTRTRGRRTAVTSATLGALSRPSRSARRPRLVGSGEFDYDIVGESNYQDALRHIAGPETPEGVEKKCTATLSPEPTNPYDARVIKVSIAGLTVGYVPRDGTDELHRVLRGRNAEAAALIVGGWDRGDRGRGHYGVRLDIEGPPQLS